MKHMYDFHTCTIIAQEAITAYRVYKINNRQMKSAEPSAIRVEITFNPITFCLMFAVFPFPGTQRKKRQNQIQISLYKKIRKGASSAIVNFSQPSGRQADANVVGGNIQINQIYHIFPQQVQFDALKISGLLLNIRKKILKVVKI